jgi:hypothetical protein
MSCLNCGSESSNFIEIAIRRSQHRSIGAPSITQLGSSDKFTVVGEKSYGKTSSWNGYKPAPGDWIRICEECNQTHLMLAALFIKHHLRKPDENGISDYSEIAD